MTDIGKNIHRELLRRRLVKQRGNHDLKTIC